MDSILKRLIKIRSLFIGKLSRCSSHEYWEKRATQYGARSVLNLGHSTEEYESVTIRQKEILFPHLKQLLTGNEEVALDYGCGPGRFTLDLANIIGGKAIGVDPIAHLLHMAPKNDRVQYMLMKNGLIPAEDASIDVVWICLVLGGIVDNADLRKCVREIDRVLKNNGLLFLVENTSEKANVEHWSFRSINSYQMLCNFVRLKHLADYIDMGERMSIMAGRKNDYSTL